jgi:hypothetical protein
MGTKVGGARSSEEPVGALASGWGWVTGPDFAAVLTMASLAVMVIGVWAGVATLYSPLRGLHVRTRVVRVRNQSVVEDVKKTYSWAVPHQVILTLILRGHSAIEPGHFAGNASLTFDVGALIVKVREPRVKPENALKPAASRDGSNLRVPPTWINTGTRITFDLITASRPVPVRRPPAILTNVRIHGLRGDDRSWRRYLMPLFGAATILIELGLPRVLPRLAAMWAYTVASIVLCVIMLLTVGVSAARLAWRPRGDGI